MDVENDEEATIENVKKHIFSKGPVIVIMKCIIICVYKYIHAFFFFFIDSRQVTQYTKNNNDSIFMHIPGD